MYIVDACSFACCQCVICPRLACSFVYELLDLHVRYVYVRFTVCSEIYPYVVIIIGLENILIIVKAVISTPEELEVCRLTFSLVSKNVLI